MNPVKLVLAVCISTSFFLAAGLAQQPDFVPTPGVQTQAQPAGNFSDVVNITLGSLACAGAYCAYRAWKNNSSSNISINEGTQDTFLWSAPVPGSYTMNYNYDTGRFEPQAVTMRVTPGDPAQFLSMGTEFAVGGCLAFEKQQSLENLLSCGFDIITLVPGAWIGKAAKGIKIVDTLVDVSKGLKILQGITKELKLGEIAAKFATTVDKTQITVAKVVTHYFGKEVPITVERIGHIIRGDSRHVYMKEVSLDKLIQTLTGPKLITRKGDGSYKFYKYFSDLPEEKKFLAVWVEKDFSKVISSWGEKNEKAIHDLGEIIIWQK